MIWVVALAALGGSVLGFVVGFVARRVATVRWTMRAVEMARLNDTLMDRVDVLEAERQKEG